MFYKHFVYDKGESFNLALLGPQKCQNPNDIVSLRNVYKV